jgi:plasmid maintenance system antidote protein VapI
MKVRTPEAASELARNLHNEPQRWLRLQDSNLMLYAQPPDVSRQTSTLELRFSVPDETARLLLQRIAKTETAPTVAGE